MGISWGETETTPASSALLCEIFRVIITREKRRNAEALGGVKRVFTLTYTICIVIKLQLCGCPPALSLTLSLSLSSISSNATLYWFCLSASIRVCSQRAHRSEGDEIRRCVSACLQSNSNRRHLRPTHTSTQHATRSTKIRELAAPSTNHF